MRIIHTLLIVLLLSGCFLKSEQKRTLEVGTKLEHSTYSNPEITGPETFTKEDDFVTLLKQEEKFKTAKMTMRIYKIIDGVGKPQLSEEIEINPETNFLSNKLPAEDLILAYGVGSFEVQYLNGNEAIASKKFTLKYAEE